MTLNNTEKILFTLHFSFYIHYNGAECKSKTIWIQGKKKCPPESLAIPLFDAKITLIQ